MSAEVSRKRGRAVFDDDVMDFELGIISMVDGADSDLFEISDPGLFFLRTREDFVIEVEREPTPPASERDDDDGDDGDDDEPSEDAPLASAKGLLACLAEYDADPDGQARLVARARADINQYAPVADMESLRFPAHFFRGHCSTLVLPTPASLPEAGVLGRNLYLAPTTCAVGQLGVFTRVPYRKNEVVTFTSGWQLLGDGLEAELVRYGDAPWIFEQGTPPVLGVRLPIELTRMAEYDTAVGLAGELATHMLAGYGAASFVKDARVRFDGTNLLYTNERRGEEARNNAKLFARVRDAGAIAVIATRDIPAGSEITVTRGGAWAALMAKAVRSHLY